MTTDHHEAAHAASEYPDADPRPRNRWGWQTAEQIGETLADIVALLAIGAAVGSFLSSLWPFAAAI